MFRITSMFCIKVKYRKTYTTERWVQSGHAGPSPLLLCLCGFPPGASALPNHQKTHTAQLFPPHRSAKPVLKRPDLWGKHLHTENTVCSQELGGPLMRGWLFLPVRFSCKMRSGSAVNSVMVFYGRTLLCFNGYQRLVKIAKLFVLFVYSILKSAEEESYFSLTDPNK